MFSKKQNKIMAFPYTRYDALICDGAVRSGKTSVMSLSFLRWAMLSFTGQAFAFCGKSVGAEYCGPFAVGQLGKKPVQCAV